MLILTKLYEIDKSKLQTKKLIPENTYLLVVFSIVIPILVPFALIFCLIAILFFIVKDHDNKKELREK